MKTVWTDRAWDEDVAWQKEDGKILNSINNLIADIKRNPFKGSGNQSPLNMLWQDGGPVAFQANIAWFIGFPEKEATLSNWRSLSGAIITSTSRLKCCTSGFVSAAGIAWVKPKEGGVVGGANLIRSSGL